MNKRRILRSVIIIVVALAVSALIAWVQVQGYKKTTMRPASPTIQTKTTPVTGVKVGGPFTLTDHTGKVFTDKNLRGQYAMIYFGFTFCPAICPTELQKMTVALNQAGPLADKIQPVFITIDPERDTQSVMASYVAQFHPRLTGLTGTPEQIEKVLKAYRIYARKVTDPAMNDYTMDHSSYIYFLNPAGDVIGLYGANSKPSEITEAIRQNIAP